MGERMRERGKVSGGIGTRDKGAEGCGGGEGWKGHVGQRFATNATGCVRRAYSWRYMICAIWHLVKRYTVLQYIVNIMTNSRF